MERETHSSVNGSERNEIVHVVSPFGENDKRAVKEKGDGFVPCLAAT